MKSCPPLLDKSCDKFNVPSNTVIDLQLLLNSAVFGVRWGYGGLCPSPALFAASFGISKDDVLLVASKPGGRFLAEQAKKYFNWDPIYSTNGYEFVGTA
jgi:hypothetical protein